uniref:RHS repeat-associated core domain-containing protein n=1 Tax=uncultured Bacteroides sp. TaxID=162156 RepID=UPI00258B8CD9
PLARENAFTERVTEYDKNGNILKLVRYGQTGANSYGVIDNLTMTLNGNQLNRVDDASTASAYGGGFEFKDAVKQDNEYAYDANGNLTQDLNKGIEDIQYNCLNLPRLVKFKDQSTITYTYAANGTKLRVEHKIGNSTTRTTYCSNVIYEDGTAKCLLTEEGYVSLDDREYHYYLKDHQGNNRVLVNKNGGIEEINHYYPFGGVFASEENVQPYKYNGKELDTKKGLNWYDYGARMYDAALGRFTTTDRFAEKYYSMSSYQYGRNNPIGNIDVNGDSIVISPNPNGLIDHIKSRFGYDTKFQKTVKADLAQLKKDDKTVAQIILKLEDSENIHQITMVEDRRKGNLTEVDKEKAAKGISQGTTVRYDPYTQIEPSGEKRTPRVGLSHELQHSYDADQGTMTREITENGVLLIEVRAINTENKIRMKTGDPKRTKYGRREVPKTLLE